MTPTRFPMRKHFKSRFTAFNIPHRNEGVAMDTIFSDTPAIDSSVTMAPIFVGKDFLVSDVYPMQSSKQFVNTLEDNIRFRGAMSKLISDYAQVEISNKVEDILRMYHSSSWHSEPYYQNQNQNPSEWCKRTIKALTNTILSWTGAPASCWLLCMSYVCYLCNRISCESLKGQIPLTQIYGVTPDISITMIYTLYLSVYYASHNQSFPSSSEEKHVFWVGFGEHVGDAITHKLLDSSSNIILYRSAVCPADDIHPNKHLLTDLGEPAGSNKPKPITFVKSHHDHDKSVSKPMAEYNSDNLIGRTFLLPPNQKGERYRASIKQKVIEISQKLDEDQNAMVDNINFLLHVWVRGDQLDVGQGRSQAIISYNQMLNYLEKESQHDETLDKFRAITDHHGPLKEDDPNYNGSLYNVMVEWEIGKITEEPLS